jgi:hypothetical protein
VVDAAIALGGRWLVEAARWVDLGRPRGQPRRPSGLNYSPFPLSPRGARRQQWFQERATVVARQLRTATQWWCSGRLRRWWSTGATNMCLNSGADVVHVDHWMATTCGRWSAGGSLGGHVASAASPPLRCVLTTNPVVRG